jgi:O-antigen/teichoic acid export membrane protein
LSAIRRITIGTAQLTLSNVFVRMLALVSMPILTLLLPPSAYGTAAIATTLVQLISVAALSGADLSYIRAYHAKQIAPSAAVEIFTWRFSLGAAIVAAIITQSFWQLFCDVLSLPSNAGWLVSTGIVLSVTSTMATARARLQGRNGILAIATACSGLGATAAGIGLAYCGWRNEFPLLVAMGAGFLVLVLLLGMPPLGKLAMPSGLSPVVRWHIFGIGAANIVTAPALAIMTSSDRWFLGHYLSADAAGIYSVSYSVAIAGMTVNLAGLNVWTPEASRLFEARAPDSAKQLGAITEGMIAVLAWVWFAVTAAGGDIVRLLAAPAFHEGAAIVPLIAGAVFFQGIAYLGNTAYALEKRVHRTIEWWGGGAAAALVLNVVLIPQTGIWGAALSQLLAFAITALGLMLSARRLFAGHINWMRVLLVLFTALIAAPAFIPAWADRPFFSLLLKFPAVLLIAAIIASYFGAASAIRAFWTKTEATSQTQLASLEPAGETYPEHY